MSTLFVRTLVEIVLEAKKGLRKPIEGMEAASLLRAIFQGAKRKKLDDRNFVVGLDKNGDLFVREKLSTEIL